MTHRFEAIVIGSSAGAIDALATILPSLPKDFGIPIIVVIHLSGDRESLIVQLFQSKCSLVVLEVEDKAPIEANKIYFAPPDYHVLIESNHHFALSSDEPVMFSRPSIDVLFESAADLYGDRLLGIILTGANSDGARGLEAIMAGGGSGIIQLPSEAYADAMPQAARERCPEASCMSLTQIAAYLQNLVKLNAS